MKKTKSIIEKVQKAIDSDIAKTIREKKDNFDKICTISDEFLLDSK